MVGTTVLYVLSASDVAQINQRRTTSESIKNRLQRNPPEWPAGAAAHLGDPVAVGDTLPMLVTRATATGSLVSGHVFLNGSDTFWVAACELVTDASAQPGQAMTLGDSVGFEALVSASRVPRQPAG